MSNAGGFKSLNRYYDMLAGNTVWNPWEPQGAFDALATVTVPSGGVASVTFAGIPSTYKHLQIRCLVQETRATYGIAEFDLRFNADSGSNYSHHGLWGDGGSASASGNASAGSIRIGNGTFGTNTGGTFGAGIIDILDYASITKNKVVRALTGVDVNGTVGGAGGRVGLFSGSWYNTLPVTSFVLTPSSPSTDFTQYSQFTLYGVR
jgi:hypothetical protein